MEEISNVVSTVFDGVWSLFSGVEVPGFGIRLSVVVLGFLLVRLSIRAISIVTGGGAGSASDSYRTSKEKASAYKKHIDSDV